MTLRSSDAPDTQRRRSLGAAGLALVAAPLAFARAGDPNYNGMPRWEPYSLPRRATMVFDTQSRLADDPRGAERRLFAKAPFIQQGS